MSIQSLINSIKSFFNNSYVNPRSLPAAHVIDGLATPELCQEFMSEEKIAGISFDLGYNDHILNGDTTWPRPVLWLENGAKVEIGPVAIDQGSPEFNLLRWAAKNKLTLSMNDGVCTWKCLELDAKIPAKFGEFGETMPMLSASLRKIYSGKISQHNNQFVNLHQFFSDAEESKTFHRPRGRN